MLILMMSLAAYRVTRFLILDTLIDAPRIWLRFRILSGKPRAWKNKLTELMECKFCLSVWVAAAAVALTDQFTVVALPWLTWLAVCGLSLVVWELAEKRDMTTEVTVKGLVKHQETKYG